MRGKGLLLIILLCILAYFFFFHSGSGVRLIVEKAGGCDKQVTQGFYCVRSENGTVAFSAIVYSYCNSEPGKTIQAFAQTSNHTVTILVKYTGTTATRCVCPFWIKGSLSRLAGGDYTFKLVFQNNYVGEQHTIDEVHVRVGRGATTSCEQNKQKKGVVG